MFAIFASHAAALAYVAECDLVLGCPFPGAPDPGDGTGVTTTWAQVQAHPGGAQWAVPELPGVPLVGVAQSTAALDVTWFPSGGY